MAIPQTTPTFSITGVNSAGTPDIITVTDATVYSDDTVAITAFADAGGGDTRASSSGHGLEVGDIVVIAGSSQAGQNGQKTVTAIVAGTSFDFTTAWTSDGGAATWYLYANSYYTTLVGAYRATAGAAAIPTADIVADNASDNLITSWVVDADVGGWYQLYMIPARAYVNGIAYALGEVAYDVTNSLFAECTTAGTSNNADPLASTGAIFRLFTVYSADIIHSAVLNVKMDEDQKQCLFEARVALKEALFAEDCIDCDSDCQRVMTLDNLFQVAGTEFDRADYAEMQRSIERMITECARC